MLHFVAHTATDVRLQHYWYTVNVSPLHRTPAIQCLQADDELRVTHSLLDDAADNLSSYHQFTSNVQVKVCT